MSKGYFRFLVAIICIMVILGLAMVVQAQKKEKMTITMWTHDYLYVQFFKARGAEWAQEYPQYEFKFDFIQIPYAEVFTKTLTALAAGVGAPDLIGIEISQFSRFMKGDIAEKCLVDLTPLVGADREKFIEARWAPYSHKGKLYGVESALCPVALYYRNDIFQKFGIKTPIALWSEFVEAGKKLAAQGHYIMATSNTNDPTFMILFQQRGGNVFDKDGNLVLDDPRAVEVLDFLVDGANKLKIFWSTSEFYSAPHFAAYKQDKVIGDIMPDWWSVYFLKPQVPEQSGKWRVQFLPAWEKGGPRTSSWGGTGFAITKQSKKVDLVWDLLKYTYMTKENQVKRFQEINYFPHMIEAFDDPGVVDVPDPYYGGQKFGAVLASVAKEMPVQYQSPYWSEAMTIMSKHASLAFTGKKTSAEAIKDAATEIAKLMKK